MMKKESRGRVPPPGEPAKGERTLEIKGDAPHSGVREALLAPMAAPALPDAVRSSSSWYRFRTWVTHLVQYMGNTLAE